MPKTLALVGVALALATTTATAAVPKVTSIRLVSDGGFVARHRVTAVDRRNHAALAELYSAREIGAFPERAHLSRTRSLICYVPRACGVVAHPEAAREERAAGSVMTHGRQGSTSMRPQRPGEADASGLAAGYLLISAIIGCAAIGARIVTHDGGSDSIGGDRIGSGDQHVRLDQTQRLAANPRTFAAGGGFHAIDDGQVDGAHHREIGDHARNPHSGSVAGARVQFRRVAAGPAAAWGGEVSVWKGEWYRVVRGCPHQRR
jgi:hypothetical protein